MEVLISHLNAYKALSYEVLNNMIGWDKDDRGKDSARVSKFAKIYVGINFLIND